MPNIKSAMKRVKVSKKKNLRNRMIKSGVKTAVKKYEAALTPEQLSLASAALDKAASKGVIKLTGKIALWIKSLFIRKERTK